MKSPAGLSIMKVVFSVLGVLCLILAGNTAVNYSKTMEAFSVVTIEPVSVEIIEHDEYYSADVTYEIANPSRLEISLLWTEALISFVYGQGEKDYIDDYSFIFIRPGELVIEPGETGEVVMKWFVMKEDTDEISLLLSRGADSMWYSFCRMKFRPTDFDHSDYVITGTGIVQEVL